MNDWMSLCPTFVVIAYSAVVLSDEAGPVVRTLNYYINTIHSISMMNLNDGRLKVGSCGGTTTSDFYRAHSDLTRPSLPPTQLGVVSRRYVLYTW